MVYTDLFKRIWLTQNNLWFVYCVEYGCMLRVYHPAHNYSFAVLAENASGES